MSPPPSRLASGENPAKTIGAFALCLVTTAFGLSACVESRASVFVRGVVPAESNAGSGGCSIDPASDQLLLGGAVDPGIASGYILDLSVANQLIARANAQQSQAETNRVVLREAEVRVTSANAVRLDRFSTLLTGMVNPSNDGASPGLGAVSINVLSAELLEKFAAEGEQEIVVFVKIFGETLGGRDVETDFFQFPVTVTRPGGLVSFPPPKDGIVDCQSTTTDSGAACRPGQNSATPCGTCYPHPLCTPR